MTCCVSTLSGQLVNLRSLPNGAEKQLVSIVAGAQFKSAHSYFASDLVGYVTAIAGLAFEIPVHHFRCFPLSAM